MYVQYVCMFIYLQIAQCNFMLVYVYPQRLRNTIIFAYVCPSRLRNYCTIQWPKCVPGDDYDPGLLPGLCDLYLMEEHNHKCFKSLPRSLHIDLVRFQ